MRACCLSGCELLRAAFPAGGERTMPENITKWKSYTLYKRAKAARDSCAAVIIAQPAGRKEETPAPPALFRPPHFFLDKHPINIYYYYYMSIYG